MLERVNDYIPIRLLHWINLIVIKLIKYKQNTIDVDGRNFLGFYTTRYTID